PSDRTLDAGTDFDSGNCFPARVRFHDMRASFERNAFPRPGLSKKFDNDSRFAALAPGG
ncbi:MAG: hypothetical protein RIR65_2264, partial [Planctomycetota bacterium]